jgi:hypothetical protein
VPFHPDPATAAADPATFDPAGARAWWCNVSAGNPDVAVSIPAVIAGVPGPIAMLGWRRRNDFMRTGGRPNTDNYLSLSHANRQEKSAGKGTEDFVHRTISFVLLKVGTRVGAHKLLWR